MSVLILIKTIKLGSENIPLETRDYRLFSFHAPFYRLIIRPLITLSRFSAYIGFISFDNPLKD